ncbi:hypothetical protein ACFPES_14380 [Paenibacillus sp. GCM10023248]|uniref:hypothetical protein n=1 Tax=Bacillales TaxID=1385 RepID=UPI002377F2E4|nr:MULTISPECIES: hypothetical protein [Bacillales]MDD9268222.1 hypothetical protein [Paenibacillus sp. MAHUQ-63]MDR6879899.1 hypothetical protein [Bacillus sp. 3255]
MKTFLKKLLHWTSFLEQLETCLEAKALKWKKRINPVTNRIGFGIYFYKHITVNLNRLNKEIIEIARDRVHLANHSAPMFPSFVSVVDGIHTTMFAKLPNHVVTHIISLVKRLPGFKELQDLARTYGYSCELRYNQGKVFFGSLQIHFIQIDKFASRCPA